MLSIIMPVYNKRPYLTAAVESVRAQTCADWELLLIDDGSTDGSGALCDTLAKTDSRIRVIHQENGGVASARNTGLENAAGDYIGWVDSDDLVHPQMYEIMLALMEQHGADIVQCATVRHPEEMSTEGSVAVLDGIGSLKRIYQSHYTTMLSLCTKLLRRDVFDGLRFTEGTAFEDDEIVPRLLARGRVNVFLDAPMYCYVKREDSIITAPKTENILALTNHLENRMLWFETLDAQLYELSRAAFYQYLKGKACEPVFRNTPVQDRAVELLDRHWLRFAPIATKYDKLSMTLVKTRWGRRWVTENDFAPVQKVLAKIKNLLGR